LVSFIVALILAAGLNIDAVAVAKALWVQPKLAEQLKFPTAPPATGTSAPGPSGTAAPAPTAAAKPPAAGTAAPGATDGKAEANPNTATLLEQLNTTLPVGWPNGLGYELYKDRDGRAFRLSAGEFGIAFVGWLIVALSTLFGAPFWFDLLQTVIRLKGSGPSPQEKVDGSGAAA
jgi:hypothetical protein